jgi:hypothetical protein
VSCFGPSGCSGPSPAVSNLVRTFLARVKFVSVLGGVVVDLVYSVGLASTSRCLTGLAFGHLSA